MTDETKPVDPPLEPAPEVAPEKAETPPPEPEKNPAEDLQRAVAASNQARRRAERDLAELRLQMETGNQRLQELMAKFEQPQAQVDPNVDPVGAITHGQKQLQQKVEELAERDQFRQEQTLRQQQEAHLERTWAASSQQFVSKQPDFPEAYNHLFHNVMRQFSRVYGEEQAGQMARGMWQDVVVAASQNGENPAAVMYEMAKDWGYKAKTDKLETIAKGTKATSPLASAGGKAPAGKLTMETLASMPQEEFNRLKQDDVMRILRGE